MGKSFTERPITFLETVSGKPSKNEYKALGGKYRLVVI
jgi:hypothetical protein